MEEDKMHTDSSFKSATLQLNTSQGDNTEPEVLINTGARIKRPLSLNATNVGDLNMSDAEAKTYFSKRVGSFENAVEDCKSLLNSGVDGDIVGAWLLTEIDHWDNEREKIVILTQNSLISVRYDFIGLKIYDSKKVLLHMITKLQEGHFMYPEKSVMEPRKSVGIRASWGRTETLSFSQKWNPWSSAIPYITFTHHPLHHNVEDVDIITYNVDNFYKAFTQQVQNCHLEKKTGVSPTVTKGSLLIESYASLTSMIHNQSHLGFSRERGGVSF
ncbi:unnamed protein product [Owenia fusiformis]|uniref:Uncharacterized protein n=1 Tax=Owenia fusiformis TaxID=6347 RepID=A0A8J1U5Y3_OWEFU|nr:unnamed protein product [Owenia fusiformis]